MRNLEVYAGWKELLYFWVTSALPKIQAKCLKKTTNYFIK